MIDVSYLVKVCELLTTKQTSVVAPQVCPAQLAKISQDLESCTHKVDRFGLAVWAPFRPPPRLLSLTYLIS